MNARLRQTAVAVLGALCLVASLPVISAEAGTHHHRHHRHHHHSAAYRQHQRHLHQLRMHRKMVRRLHRSMPNGVGFHRFYDHRTHSVIHVATIRPGARVRLRPVPASVALHKRRLVKTSRMCRRVHCILAVNGSFRDLPSRLPRGAEVVNGVPLKLQADQPRQAVFSQRRPVELGAMHTEIRLHQRGVGTVYVHRINMWPGDNGAALFTKHFGPRTPRGLTTRVDLLRAGRLRLGHSYRVAVHGLRSRSTRALPSRRQLALVTHGRSAWDLRWFMHHVDHNAPITLTTTSPAPAPQTLGTSFRLLHNWHEVAPRKHWHLIRGREPRTVLATRPNGTVMLITIDGRWRRHSAGASMRQAAFLARRLGASEAVNLDGGGSTTFVARGHVLNHPSDGWERGVVNSLVLVRAPHRYDPHYLQRLRARRAAEREAEATAIQQIVEKVLAEKQAKLLRMAQAVDESSPVSALGG